MNDQAPDKAPSLANAKVEVWLAGVLMIIAFAVGFALHGLVNEPGTPAQQQPITGAPAGGVVPAAPLTDAQLQGGLPAGHPEVVPGQTGAGAPSASPTKDGHNKNNDNNAP